MALSARVQIDAARRVDRTVLTHSFWEPPFKIANITEGGGDGFLKLMLMSCAPGVLDGDDFCFDIAVAEGASVSMETQSYQRIFQMRGEAKQKMNIEVGNDASFVYLPHPTVPHRCASFTARNQIYLHRNSSLFWSDVVSCGRKLNNEVFAFTKYHSCTEIFMSGKLVLKENLWLEPAVAALNKLGQLEGYTHQMGMFLMGRTVDDALAHQVLALLATHQGIDFGVTALAVPGLMIRVLGGGAEHLYSISKQLLHLLNAQQFFNPQKTTSLV